jgi:hypothetical protein
VDVEKRNLPAAWRNALDTSITLKELQLAVYKGEGTKTPVGTSCLKFFKATRGSSKSDMLAPFNQVFKEDKITKQQKMGIRMCIPKSKGPTIQKDYGTIARLNNDYKILARIIANRLSSTLTSILQSVLCGAWVYDIRIHSNSEGRESAGGGDSEPITCPLPGLHGSLQQDISYVPIYDLE